jgi:hypothetical protein
MKAIMYSGHDGDDYDYGHAYDDDYVLLILILMMVIAFMILMMMMRCTYDYKLVLYF